VPSEPLHLDLERVEALDAVAEEEAPVEEETPQQVVGTPERVIQPLVVHKFRSIAYPQEERALGSPVVTPRTVRSIPPFPRVSTMRSLFLAYKLSEVDIPRIQIAFLEKLTQIIAQLLAFRCMSEVNDPNLPLVLDEVIRCDIDILNAVLVQCVDNVVHLLPNVVWQVVYVVTVAIRKSHTWNQLHLNERPVISTEYSRRQPKSSRSSL
jgi:hypothetical protein